MLPKAGMEGMIAIMKRLIRFNYTTQKAVVIKPRRLRVLLIDFLSSSLAPSLTRYANP